MEGLLQAFKFPNPEVQREVCKLTGLAAKSRGRNRNWRDRQTLYWLGVPYKRKSEEYQALLRRAYITMAEQSDSFRRALMAAKGAAFTHSMGKRKENETVL